MKWNLVDHLSPSSGKRAFFPPLGALGPGMASTNYPPATSWDYSRVQVDRADGSWTDDIVLEVTAFSPASGFVDEGTLPDPRIRLHAMGAGQLRFKPAVTGGPGASLELNLGTFLDTALQVSSPNQAWPAWWERWMDAGCIPTTLVYENVDATHLGVVLQAIAAPVDSMPASQVAPSFGLSFPSGVLSSDKAAFITGFMNGDYDHFIVAEAGAVIGRIAAQSSVHMLKLHARYQDHSVTVPSPMSPLELLYLLFGESSAESQTHPFLLGLNATGATQRTASAPVSTFMTMRPPLRTSERLKWEVNLEKAYGSSSSWGLNGSLGPTKFFNKSKKHGRHFDNSNYTGKWKCNLFVCDFAMRSGFRVPVLPIGGTQIYHYNSPNMLANYAHDEQGTGDKVALTGRQFSSWSTNTQDKNAILGWKIQGPAGSGAEQAINRWILTEGRCLIISLAAARAFYYQASMSATICRANAPVDASGHMMVVSELLGAPVFAPTGEGLVSLAARYVGAGKTGIYSVDGTYVRRSQRTAGYVRIHLTELHPGKDPDTIQGQADLNIAVFATPTPRTEEFAARDTGIVVDANGQAVTAITECCRDFISASTPTGAPDVIPRSQADGQ